MAKGANKQPKTTRPRNPSVPARSQSGRAAPTALSFPSRVGPPKMSAGIQGSSSGSIRVKRTEFVGSLTNLGVTGYSLIGVSAQTPGYDINPGCSLLFPWLSTIACNFERFRFHDLSFRLIPSQASTTPGRYYAAIDYDYDDAVAVSKTSLMSNRTVQESVVWDELRMVADPKELHPDMRAKFVSTVTRTNFVEPRTAFCGYLMVAVDTTVGNLLFDLEVSYDVSLDLPVLEVGLSFDTVNATSSVNLSSITPTQTGASSWGLTLSDKLKLPTGSFLRAVESASVGTLLPASFYGNSGFMLPPGASFLDLSEAPRNRGTLSLVGGLSSTTVSPTNLLATYNLQPKFSIYDSLGYYLGSDNTIPSNVTNGVIVPVGSAAATVGQAVRYVSKMGLKAIFDKFANARYILPFLESSPSIGGLGLLTGGYHLEL